MKLNLLYCLIPALLLVSCADEALFGGTSPVGEGESLVTATVEFSPLTPALNGGTRSKGDAIKAVSSLCVLLYDADGNLACKIPLTEGAAGAPGTYVLADSARKSDTEAFTPSATMTLAVPYGRYYIYAVANMGDLSGHADRIATVAGLRSIPLTWSADNISANSQMLGHFCPSDEMTDEAPLLTIDRPATTFHSWLRRAASKVTVAYDGSRLAEGVFIYLKSVQIKDIPAGCTLGDDNTPTSRSGLITDGETIVYAKGTDYSASWPARITKGRPNYPADPETHALHPDAHTERAEALYFYENMQGEGESKKQDWKDPGHITYPGGNHPDSLGFKDNKPYGTYIEVKAFYRSINSERVGSGDIVYRFMLGKDTDTDYNAERNHHYRLTLQFNRFANDVDWHIDYEEETPSAHVPDPYYISYLYNHSMMLPLKINYGSYTVKSVTARIDTSSWAPYHGDTKDLEFYTGADADTAGVNRWNGFLSLKQTTALNVSSNDSGNNKDLFNARKLGDREYPFNKVGWDGKADSGRYFISDNKEAKTLTYQIPMFTREKQLISATAYTGNNPFEAYMRKAVVSFDITLKDGEGNERHLKTSTTILQTPRITNPKGVWRRHDSTTPFHVTLMHREGERSKSYKAFSSEGPWKAYVVTGDRKTIHLESDTVKGSTGSDIDFDILFEGCGEDESRCAIIRVEYHNYSCYHLIFACQGSAPVQLLANGTRWHISNLRTATEEGVQPTEEGSLFRFGNLADPIDASSNVNDEADWNTRMVQPNDFKRHDTDYFTIAGGGGSKKWSEIGSSKFSESFTDPTVGGRSVSVAQFEDYENLYKSDDIAQGYGVLYGDDAEKTLTDVDEVFGYRHDNKGKGYGMRGCFVYNKTLTGDYAGRSIFFPIGVSGYGHRKHRDKKFTDSNGNIVAGVAVLRYSAGQFQQIANPQNRPLFYELYKRPGATYWVKIMRGKEAGARAENILGWDINYYTFDFNHLPHSNLFGNDDKKNELNVSDACFIRCVEK